MSAQRQEALGASQPLRDQKLATVQDRAATRTLCLTDNSFRGPLSILFVQATLDRIFNRYVKQRVCDGVVGSLYWGSVCQRRYVEIHIVRQRLT